MVDFQVDGGADLLGWRAISPLQAAGKSQGNHGRQHNGVDA
jgi:hypothetical protein